MQYDSFGNIELHERVHPKKLICLRMQVFHIHSEHTDECLGSVIYANSFLYIEQTNSINLTKNVPNFQSWFTTHKHFMNMPVPILTEKNL